jgi:hypothetical protein
VAIWTGLGLSLSTASYLRWMLLLVCVALLLFLIVELLGRIGTTFRNLKIKPHRSGVSVRSQDS